MDRIYRPENGTLYVVGRMEDPDAVEAAIRTNWAGWEVKGDFVEFTDMPTAPEPLPRSITVIDKERVTQTNVRLTCQTGPGTLENKESIEMFAGLMDRSAWVALREQAGVTYGAGSYSATYNGGAAIIMFNSLVQNDAVGLAVDVFLDMSKNAIEGDLDADRLTVNKLGAARKYVLGHQTSGQMLNRIASAEITGFGWDYLNKRSQRLADVDVDSVQAMAEKCYEHEAVVITGPAAVITPQLDTIGVEYTVFDWKEEKERLYRENDPKAYKKAKKKEAREAKKKARKEAKESAE
jgi:predicted Zn-dependent peptidase